MKTQKNKKKLPPISVVSLNWNSSIETLELLDSIRKADYPKSKLEVIVIDNASTDGSPTKIKKNFPKTKVIELPKNLGTSARNAGLKIAKGEIIFCIDSDVSISKDLFKKVVKKIQGDPDIGLLGVMVLWKKTHLHQPTCIKLNFFTGVISPVNTTEETNRCTYLPAIIHIFPRSLIKKVGMYNTQHFFYGEDVDFCLRVKKLGLKIVYFPQTSVFHGKKSSKGDLPLSFRLPDYYKSLFQITFRYANLFQQISTLVFQLTLIPIYRLIIQRENTFPQRLKGLWWNIKHPKLKTFQ